MGLHLAGFAVTGIDVAAQPAYPFPFMRVDVAHLAASDLGRFDFVWASPPCQHWTDGSIQKGTHQSHADLVDVTRQLLRASGVPWVIENIPKAPVRRDLLLCGAMFGLKLVRHRYFELDGFKVSQPKHPPHHPESITVTGHPGGRSMGGRARFGNLEAWRAAMGISWLAADALREAVPPRYATYIGKAAKRHA
jgi:DNA (cytosine-5)-methyltransferase 1